MPKRQSIYLLGNDRILAKFVARILIRLYPERAVDIRGQITRSACKRLTALPEMA